MHGARRRGFPTLSWLLVVAWVAVIWGHSLLPGQSSSAESGLVVQLVQRVAYELFTREHALFARVVAEHPSVVAVLRDSARLSFYVRKTAHFLEYFVLAILAFRAATRTFDGMLARALTIGVLWAGVPYADEAIQRHVPDRAGQLSDVLLDMCGFGTALALCVALACLAALLRWLFGGGRGEEPPRT